MNTGQRGRHSNERSMTVSWIFLYSICMYPKHFTYQRITNRSHHIGFIVYVAYALSVSSRYIPTEFDTGDWADAGRHVGEVCWECMEWT